MDGLAVSLFQADNALWGTGDIDEPGTLQEDLLTLLKVRYDLRAGQNATGSQSLDVCTHFIECHFGR